MATVAADLPRPTEITNVDPHKLMGSDARVTVDAETGLPKELRAFVVIKDPCVTVAPHFFSDAECDHLLTLVEDYWMPSLVGQAARSAQEEHGEGDLENTMSTTRTSWSCMMRYAQTAVVERLERRMARLSGLPLENLERMNAVRYAPGELFDEHHDGKFRPCTVFVYLNDLPPDEEGGDTFFPILGVSFTPRRGTALMWSNAADGTEDSRMLHCARPPLKGVKYGVNCFFNAQRMRQLAPSGPEVPLAEATVVRVASLGPAAASEGRRLVAYRLCLDPKVVAVPGFLTAEEAEALLELAGGDGLLADGPKAASCGPFDEGTRTLRAFRFEETPVVKAVEERLASTAGLGLGHLGALRVVRAGTRPGLANRGCGPKSAYVCLGGEDEVFFARLGMRLQLQRGDALMWPNVDWESGQAVEDLRTLRVHLRPALGLDGFFHDAPLREQQSLRRFVPEAEACPPAVMPRLRARGPA